MSRKNAVKIKINQSESSGYFFKSSSSNQSFVISSKHGVCSRKNECEQYLNNEQNCCKVCKLEIDINNVKFEISGGEILNPRKYYLFKNKDIVISEVDKISNYPLRIGKMDNDNYYLYGYKDGNYKPGRILLNRPDLSEDMCYFNISSDPTPELIEKKDGYYGISGSLVLELPERDILVAHAVITTNEEHNDLGAEVLYDIDFKEINDHFGCKVFLENYFCIASDSSFNSHFKNIGEVYIGNNLKINVNISKYSGIPYFNLNPIAESLIDSKMYHVFGCENISDNKNIISASKIILNKSHLEPANKLLTSKMIESFMQAPHLYSTSIETSNYHHIHIKSISTERSELLVSFYGGSNDLSTEFSDTLENILKNINSYSLNKNSIIERSFLNQKFSEEQCEMLYELLFGELGNTISSISLLYVIPLESIAMENKKLEIEIMEFVKNKSKTLIDNGLVNINEHIDLNVFIFPTNKENELSDIMQELINEC